MQPAILEAALNGVTRKATNPNVPRSTDELVRDAFACLDAGAAIVHTHIDEPGAPAERAAELYTAHFAPVLAARPDALLYPTVGFAKTVEASFAHFPLLVERLGLRIGIIDPGSYTRRCRCAERSAGPRRAARRPRRCWIFRAPDDSIRHRNAIAEPRAPGIHSLATSRPALNDLPTGQSP